MPIEKVEGGYRWGGRGTVYPDRAEAVAQAAAAHANGYIGDEEWKAAFADDAEFNESDHPRANNGQFGSGGEGSGSKGGSSGGGSGGNEAALPGMQNGKPSAETVKHLLKAPTDMTPAVAQRLLEAQFGDKVAGARIEAGSDHSEIHNPNGTKGLRYGVEVHKGGRVYSGLLTINGSHYGSGPVEAKFDLSDEVVTSHGAEKMRAHDWAFDKASVRTKDDNGRLRVEQANISKANVCPYLGSEIPDWETLGLDPDKQYMLLRDPQALAAAADSFNGIPVLDVHVPSTAWDHPAGKVIGTTGTDAVFEAPYLKNSLVFWTQDAIDDIEAKDRQELSCGYTYTPDMTPGKHEGVPYDGRMLDILGNHVALVQQGRAGPDVVVGDSQPQPKETGMPKQAALSQTAQLVRGALAAHLRPIKLAKDAKIDLKLVLKDVSKKTYAADKARIVAALKPKLANDTDVAGVEKVLELLGHEIEEGNDEEPIDTPNAVDADPEKAVMDMFRSKGATDEEVGAMGEMLKKVRPAASADGLPEPGGKMGADKDEEDDKEKVSKPAMDAAIKAASDAAEKRTVARMNGIAEAREFVAPWAGKLAGAFDSAEGVYRAACDVLKIEHKDVHADALRPIISAQPKPGELRGPQRHAADEARGSANADFLKEYPDAAAIRVV